MIIELLLKIFYDEYGVFKFLLNLFAFLPIHFILIIVQDKWFKGKFNVSMYWLAITFIWFYAMSAMNPYKYIPSYGTAAQKSTLAKCTQGQTVTEDSIKEVMKACRKAGKDLK